MTDTMENRCANSDCSNVIAPAAERPGRRPLYCSHLCRSRAANLRRRQRVEGVTSKLCSGCKEEKAIEEFSQAWRHYCRDCQNARNRQRYHASDGKERIYAANLAANYNLTPEQYADRVQAQGGRCAICDEEPAHRLHVDHDHQTGAVRDLLCRPCNYALGHAKDDPARLRAMADYLDRHRSNPASELR